MKTKRRRRERMWVSEFVNWRHSIAEFNLNFRFAHLNGPSRRYSLMDCVYMCTGERAKILEQICADRVGHTNHLIAVNMLQMRLNVNSRIEMSPTKFWMRLNHAPPPFAMTTTTTPGQKRSDYRESCVHKNLLAISYGRAECEGGKKIKLKLRKNDFRESPSPAIQSQFSNRSEHRHSSGLSRKNHITLITITRKSTYEHLGQLKVLFSFLSSFSLLLLCLIFKTNFLCVDFE